MRAFLLGGTMALSLLGGPGGADPVVIELFTSQGCASCPPADEMLRELAAMEGVLPLALHVDYWDYIGWQDTFGSPRFTARQQAYALAAGERMVYTPQLIIGGRARVIGADPMAVMAHVRAQAGVEGGVYLTLGRTGEDLSIQAEASAVFPVPVLVQVVRYLPEAEVEISRGENAGSTLVYVNIVTDWQLLGEWDGAQPLSFTIPAPGTDPAVVILQEPGPGAILAAAELR